MGKVVWGAAVAVLVASAALALAQQTATAWISAGATGVLQTPAEFPTPTGRVGLLLSGGPVEMTGHPFFTPLGSNGRACVTCHQPAYGMSFSAEAARDLWKRTRGKDPLFAAIDGSNCPNLPQTQEKSHSLLLERGLIRVFLPVPKNAEFTISVVSDPTGCNTSPTYGLNSPTPTVSVYRRPRMAANLKYVTNPAPRIVLKLGALADTDPATGRPVGMNFMADAREATLMTQARNATMGHEEAQSVTDEQLRKIVEFENQVYVAQISDRSAGSLAEPGGPQALGPAAMAAHRPGVLGDNDYDSVFLSFESWKKGGGAQEQFRASVARGAELFMFRQFWLRDVTHINSIGLGNPLKRTCATCHNHQMTGQDLSAGFVDLGTTNYPRWTEPPLYSEASNLPVFKITCKPEVQPHPYLGRVIYTSDPGRALISGRCADVGSIVMQQFRGLSARAPYFSNGSAKNLRELVDYYDRRFDMKLSEAEKQDLINFLGVL
jgi:cytochrome c peroxidase